MDLQHSCYFQPRRIEYYSVNLGDRPEYEEIGIHMSRGIELYRQCGAVRIEICVELVLTQHLSAPHFADALGLMCLSSSIHERWNLVRPPSHQVCIPTDCLEHNCAFAIVKPIIKKLQQDRRKCAS